MTTAMTQAEREAFLAEARVGVLAVEQPAGPPIAVPVWYAYAPGGLLSISTDGGSRKAVLIRAAGRFTLCVQDERRPYKYVSVECALAAVERAAMDERRALAIRYLGPDEGARFAADLEDSESEVMLRARPVKWRTVDYAKADDAEAG